MLERREEARVLHAAVRCARPHCHKLRRRPAGSRRPSASYTRASAPEGTPGRTTPGKFSQLSSPGREKLALSPAIDPDIEAYAQWLEDKITREAENVGFLEGRGHSPYKS